MPSSRIPIADDSNQPTTHDMREDWFLIAPKLRSHRTIDLMSIVNQLSRPAGGMQTFFNLSVNPHRPVNLQIYARHPRSYILRPTQGPLPHKPG